MKNEQAEPVGYFVNDESDDQWHQVDYEQRNGADTYPLYLHPPAVPQQAKPVGQIGWADEFGNLFPMGAWKPTQRTHHDSHKTAWRAVYLHPPANEVQRLRADAEKKDALLVRAHDLLGCVGGSPEGASKDRWMAEELQRDIDAARSV